MVEPGRTTDGVAFLRTPDANFEGLDGFSYAPRYVQFEGLRQAYIDEGPRDGPVALLVHGMPTWSFLYRRIISALTARGWRCIAPDHIGFGRSDKPVEEAWYSIARHARAHAALVEGLKLEDITLFCQDWGGPIGLMHAMARPDLYSRLVIMNTWLHHEGYDYSPALRRWNEQWSVGGLFREMSPEPLSMGWLLLVGTQRLPADEMLEVVRGGEAPALSPALAAIKAGYDAPFAGLGREGFSGPRRFPLCLPFADPAAAEAEAQARAFEALKAWDKPAHFIWGGRDDVFVEDWGRRWAALVPHATFDRLPDAGHFLQDTHGGSIVRALAYRMALEAWAREKAARAAA